MPRGRRGQQRPYPPEFRQQMVELVRSGRSPEKLEAEFGVTAPTIRAWVRQAELDGGARSDGLTTSGADGFAVYAFGDRHVRHCFCKTCGICTST